jgi:lysyl-tRNA synthetase class 2
MKLRHQFQLINHIRNFFIEKNFLDVITPPVVQNPGMETHIHPFQIFSTRDKKPLALYLHTSPEFWMKYLLAHHQEEKIENIFTISYVMRDEPDSPLHRKQFLMLEWYRLHARYEQIMQDCQDLISSCFEKMQKTNAPPWTIFTIQEIVQKICGIDILNYLETDKLIKLLTEKFPDVPLPKQKCQWDDYFFLLFLNRVEPELKKYPLLILKEYPAPLAALSTLKREDPRVCERFEIYLNGVEIANCYHELTDVNEQKKRFSEQNLQKKSLYGYDLPRPSQFYQTMEKGLPQCSGIALGIERLLGAVLGSDPIFWD